MMEYFSSFCFLLILGFAPKFVAGEILLEKVADAVEHGEGPHWDAEKGVLYYVDIFEGTVSKFTPENGTVNRMRIDGGPVSLVIPIKNSDDQFVVGLGRDLVGVKWDGISDEPSAVVVLATVDQEKPENRFNDGKVDESGRLWAGTMGPENPDLRLNEGSLFSFQWSNEFKPEKHLSPVSVSNGIAWNDENDQMYYIDSPTRVINVFDFDISTGKISNRRDLFSLDENDLPGVPDGMTIDQNGNLWVALYNGSSIINVDTKSGKLLRKVNLPVTHVTSCAFGGKDLQDLYVTTSRKVLTEEEMKSQPTAGSLFRLTGLGVFGQVHQNKVVLKKTFGL